MKLAGLINRYVKWKTSLGMRFRSDSDTLKSFCGKIGDIDMADVEPAAVLDFLNGSGEITAYWHQKYKILNEFYRFAISRGYTETSPLPKIRPKCPPPSPPYIYTTEELRRLLSVTETLETRWSPLQADTFRVLFLLLYGTGLRINEARLLSIADANLAEKLLQVRDAKFHKTRLVPTGPRLTKELRLYAKKRVKLPKPAGDDSAFFCTRTGAFLSYRQIGEVFRRLRVLADIHRSDGARYQPRIHDLRHTATVHRLVDWYRAGKDLNRLLPALSTYLGHVEVSSTQRYLTVTHDLLDEASRRFEKYASTGENA